VQVGIDLLRLNVTARLIVANVEMVPALLVERVVSRLVAVPLTAITDRKLTAEQLAGCGPPWHPSNPSPAGWRSFNPPSPSNTSPPPAPRSGRTYSPSTRVRPDHPVVHAGAGRAGRVRRRGAGPHAGQQGEGGLTCVN